MKHLTHSLIVAAMVATSIFAISHAKAAPEARAFGETWQPQAAPVKDQAQVVYYRVGEAGKKPAALVTLNGELHAALLPGMFTRICVQPGTYTLGALLDAPDAQQQNFAEFQAALKPGKTYFVRVNTQADGKPQAVRRIEAERQLPLLRLQQHVLSRSSAVVECRYDEEPKVKKASH